MYPKHVYEHEPMNRRESQWEPIPLQLPLHQPYWPEAPGEEAEEENQDNSSHGVLIIDMNDYTEIQL